MQQIHGPVVQWPTHFPLAKLQQTCHRQSGSQKTGWGYCVFSGPACCRGPSHPFPIPLPDTRVKAVPEFTRGSLAPPTNGGTPLSLRREVPRVGGPKSVRPKMLSWQAYTIAPSNVLKLRPLLAWNLRFSPKSAPAPVSMPMPMHTIALADALDSICVCRPLVRLHSHKANGNLCQKIPRGLPRQPSLPCLPRERLLGQYQIRWNEAKHPQSCTGGILLPGPGLLNPQFAGRKTPIPATGSVKPSQGAATPRQNLAKGRSRL